jgi:hypothetical protein
MPRAYIATILSSFEAQKLVKAEGGSAYLNSSVRSQGITGTARNYRPDVLHVGSSGGINTVEVASVSQQSGAARAYLYTKTDDIGNAVASQGRDYYGKVIQYGDSAVGYDDVYTAFYRSSVTGSMAGYQGIQAFANSGSAFGAPYSSSGSGTIRLGK